MIRVTRKHDGEEVYVHPEWIQLVTPEKSGGACIWFGGVRDDSISVRESASEVARAIDEGGTEAQR